jgi:hypothetical protein
MTFFRLSEVSDDYKKPNDSHCANLPVFSTMTNSVAFEGRPGWDIVNNIVLVGKCNTVIKTDRNLKPAEFTEGALYAVAEITRVMAESDDLNQLEGQLTPECLAGAKENLTELSAENRQSMVVNREDVILSWIAKSMRHPETGEHRMVFATMSVPGIHWTLQVRLA